MSKQVENIALENVELKIINSNAYYILKIIGIIVGVIGALIAGAILNRGASKPFIDKYIELPLWASLLLYILTLVLLGIAVFLQFNKNKNKGQISLTKNEIKINKETFPIENKSIKFYFNSLKHKSSYKRDFMEGCNNWIEFENNGKIIKKEFEIESKIHDDNILNQITNWQQLGMDVNIKEKKRNFWQMWNEF